MDTATAKLDCGFAQHLNPELAALLQALKLDVRYCSGHGSWLTDSHGRRYLDFVCGYGAVAFGHSPDCVRAVLRRMAAADAPALVQPSILDAAGRLASRLARLAPPGLQRVWLANSGAEAVEAAIKACRAATGRQHVVYARGSFHGKTLGALSATGAPKYQAPFGAPVPGFHAVDFGDLAALQRLLQEQAEQLACVILEPIQGEGGVVEPPAGYLPAVRELCQRHGVPLVLDEVQTGLGRTGSLFACEHEQVMPDALVLSKALGAGVVPIGCVLMNERLASSDFSLLHSSTYAGNTLACEVALAALAQLDDPASDLLAQVRLRSAQLRAGLLQLQARHPAIVRGVRGRGLLLGLELHYEGPAAAGPGSVLHVASEQGHLVALLSAYLLNVEGIRAAPALAAGRVLRIEPALTVTEAECAHFLAGLDRALARLQARDTAALLRPLIDEPASAVREPAWPLSAVRPGLDEPQPGDARIAFLVHSLEPRFSVALDPALAPLGEAGVREAVNLVARLGEPAVVSRVRIASAGAAVHLEFICLPHYAQALIELGEEAACALVQRAVDLAAARGARLVGLGGYTSIVTAGGLRAQGRGVAITTGNTYTVITAVDAVREALTVRGLAPADAHVLIIGATGMIGGTLVGHYLGRVRQLTLAGNPGKPVTTRRRLLQHLEAALPLTPRAWRESLGMDGGEADWPESARRLLDGEGHAGVDATSDTAAALSRADVVICCTSTTETLVDVTALKPGATVLDLSRPHNVDREAARQRPDVLFIEGGLANFPGRVSLGLDVGAPAGQGLACMAETVMLGLAGHFEDTSIGARIDVATQTLLRELAQRFGFSLGSLRSFNRSLDSGELREVFAGGRPGAPPLSRAAAEPLHLVPPGFPGNLAAALLHSHRTLDSVPALVESETGLQISYPALWRRTVATAARLRQEGIGQGDVVVLCAADGIAAACALLACWWIGAIAAPLNPTLGEDDRRAVLGVLAPRCILLDAPRAALLASGAFDGWSCRALEVVAAEGSDHLHLPADERPAALEAGAPAVILFSSGSSGRPKAFVHTHGDFLTAGTNYLPAVVGLQPGERVFSPSRMYFAYGLLAVSFALLVGGTSILAPQPAKSLDLAALVQRHQPHVVFAVPTLLKFLCAQWPQGAHCASLRLVVSAGEPLPASLWQRARARLGVEVLDGIGCTEVLSTYVSNRRGHSRPDCTGQVVPGFEVRLVDERGATCLLGQPGVLWVRGPTLAPGAYQDPGLSAEVFRDGWFNTNDLFEMQADGSFHYLGRANDVLKINGCWVAPTLIEDVLLGHPAVEECAVVPAVDDDGMVRPKAVVVLRPQPTNAEPWHELQDLCRRQLGAHQYPHFFESRISLPRTPSGKLQRALLR